MTGSPQSSRRVKESGSCPLVDRFSQHFTKGEGKGGGDGGRLEGKWREGGDEGDGGWRRLEGEWREGGERVREVEMEGGWRRFDLCM